MGDGELVELCPCETGCSCCHRRWSGKISRRSDKRREERHKLNAPAWIKADGEAGPRDCTVVDISTGGARLELVDIDTIPDTFSLMLSKHGQPRYQCNVVWKAAAEVGVEFVEPADTAAAEKSVDFRAPPAIGGPYANAGLERSSVDSGGEGLQRAPRQMATQAANAAAHGFGVRVLLRRLSEQLGRQISTD